MTAPSLAFQVQGQGTVTADNLNTYEQTCNIADDLRGFVGTEGVQVYMRGYTSISDGGQGEFYWNATGTGPDDNGVTNIVPNGAGTGCWTRITSNAGTATPAMQVISTNTNITLATAYTAFVATADLTLNLTRTTQLNNTYWFDIEALGGSVTLHPNSNDTINVNGAAQVLGADFIIPRGASARVYTDAVGNWYVKFFGPRLNLEATVASASTTNLGGAPSNIIVVSGTTSITSLGNSASLGNPLYFVRFSGILTLTYNSTSLILPGLANIVTAPGDSAVFEFMGSGNWRCLSYQAVAGQPIGGQVRSVASGLSVTVTSDTATSITFNGLMLTDSSGNGNSYFANGTTLTNATGTSGAGGIDTGSVAINTWYSVYVIFSPTSNTLNTLLVVAGNTPSMPSGYVYNARVGNVRTDGSSLLKRTLQYDNVAQYVIGSNPTDIPVMASGTATAWTAVATGSYVPPSARRIQVTAFVDSIAGSFTHVVPNSSYNTLLNKTHMEPLGGASQASGSAFFIQGLLTLESTNIYWASGHANNAIGCIGWQDSL